MWATVGTKISASFKIQKKIVTTKHVLLKNVLKDTREAADLEINGKEEIAVNLFRKKKILTVTYLVLKHRLRA